MLYAGQYDCKLIGNTFFVLFKKDIYLQLNSLHFSLTEQ